MVQVEMSVARGMDELAGLQAAHLCHHHAQQGVRGNVERHAQEGVGTSLVKLKAEPTLRDVELEDGMAGWESHLVHLGHVPCRYNHAAGIGIVTDLVEHHLNLVDGAAVVVGPRPPLVPVDGTQLAVLVGPLIPYTHAVLLQVAHIRVALQEPQQFVDDALQVELLRGEQGETFAQVVAALRTEDGECARARAVSLLRTFTQYAVEDVQILLHYASSFFTCS